MLLCNKLSQNLVIEDKYFILVMILWVRNLKRTQLGWFVSDPQGSWGWKLYLYDSSPFSI